MRIVYMGTPDFAVAPLEAMLEAGHEIVLAVTQPDKKKGRSKEPQPTPVKVCAQKHGIEVFQPVQIRSEEGVEKLRMCEADLFVVAAFGQILSQKILDMPKYGCINIHASLLPKYRGAAPIQWSIVNGERESGVTIMQMDAGIDTGDMLLKETVPIDAKETGETLHDKLSTAGARLIVQALPLIESGSLTPEKQDDARSCYAKMLTKEHGRIDWNKSAEEIERLIRGLNPWPSAYTQLDGKTLKIWDADAIGAEDERYRRLTEEGAGLSAPKSSGNASSDSYGMAGVVLAAAKAEILVLCGDGVLSIRELQLEGKKRMKTREFLLGRTLEAGMRLGS